MWGLSPPPPPLSLIVRIIPISPLCPLRPVSLCPLCPLRPVSLCPLCPLRPVSLCPLCPLRPTSVGPMWRNRHGFCPPGPMGRRRGRRGGALFVGCLACVCVALVSSGR